MRVKIQRIAHLKDATIGTLTVHDDLEELDSVTHEPIYTLENPKRKTKVDDRIDAGIYECAPYSGTKYKNVYLVKDVPGRSAILLHWGNTQLDTEGCILLGNRIGELKGLPAVLESKKCFERFRKIVGRNEFTLIVED